MAEGNRKRLRFLPADAANGSMVDTILAVGRIAASDIYITGAR
jgi:hypothetical protein